jgi:phospholipid transport system substrate-binding protein
MITVTGTTRFAAVLASALMLGATPAMVRAEPGDPAQRISGYDEAVIGVMKAKLSLPARADRFEAVVKVYYDMPAIAALVVGPAWTNAPAAEKAAAIAALTRHSAVSLAHNFVAYSGEQFVVDPKVIDRGSDRAVKVTIDTNVLFYRMRQSGGQWKIVDVISGGVSQLTLQRADLAATVQKGGLPAMVKQLGQLDSVK